MMTEGEKTCSICTADIKPGSDLRFVNVPLCSRCFADLGLDGVKEVEPDGILANIVDEKGSEILGMTTSLLQRNPSANGWQILRMAPVIWEQVEDITRKVMMSSGLIILGSALIRQGNETDGNDLDNKFVTLLILLGQYLDLAVMGRINEEMGLEKGSFIHEMILKEEHDHRIFSLLKTLDPGEDDERKAILANSMSLLMP